jgi:hypothetical protein
MRMKRWRTTTAIATTPIISTRMISRGTARSRTRIPMYTNPWSTVIRTIRICITAMGTDGGPA